MDNDTVVRAFTSLAQDAVQAYIKDLLSAIGNETDEKCCWVRHLLKDDLAPAMQQRFVDLLVGGRGVRVAAGEARAYVSKLLQSQSEMVALGLVGSDESQVRDALKTCLEKVQFAAENLPFPNNFDDLVAIETRRLADVQVDESSRPIARGRVFSNAPPDCLWPRQPRPRLVDEHSVSDPTCRPGSYYHG